MTNKPDKENGLLPIPLGNQTAEEYEGYVEDIRTEPVTDQAGSSFDADGADSFDTLRRMAVALHKKLGHLEDHEPMSIPSMIDQVEASCDSMADPLLTWLDQCRNTYGRSNLPGSEEAGRCQDQLSD